jgi:hypothetical protein
MMAVMWRTALSGLEGVSEGWWSRWRLNGTRVGIRRSASAVTVSPQAPLSVAAADLAPFCHDL